MQKLHVKGWTDHPVYHGELFGVNAHGSSDKYLVWYTSRSNGNCKLSI